MSTHFASTIIARVFKGAMAMVLVVSLLATACGGSDPLEGQAVRVAAQSDQFCTEAYSDLWGDFATNAIRSDNAQDFAASLSQILSVLPDEAPRELRRFYETYEEIALLSIDLPAQDVADSDAQRRYADIDAAQAELEGFDQDVIAGYVSSTCPNEYAARGFLQPGGSAQVAQPPVAAAEPTATPIAAPSESAEPADPTEPTEPELQTTELPLTLNVGTFDGVDIELFGAQSTTATPESLLAGEPVVDPDGQNWLLVHVGLTNNFSSQGSFGTAAFRLIGPDGRPAVEEERLDSRGRIGAFRSIASREFIEASISFPTRELVTDLSGWTLVADQDDGVPEAIPLDTEYVNPYPLELEAGGVGIIRQESSDDFGGCAEPIGEWEAEVTEAFVHVDPLSGSGVRVPSGERWVTVRLFATNVGALKGNTYCDVGAELGGNMDLRLAVDGRSTGNIGQYGYNTTRIATGESTTMQASFRIGADASTLALITGPDNEVIVEWAVDLPLILDR